jgi:beta-lactamase regulating signal transducer with metallopeptidase domain
MNPALDDGVARLGMALLHFVWQGALVGCVAAAGLAMLRNARPQARYAFCSGALLLCAMLPLWQALAPEESGGRALAMLIPADAVTAPMPPPSHVLSAASLRPGLSTVVLLWSVGAGLMSLRLLAGLAYIQRLGAASAGGIDAIDRAWHARLAVLARRMGLRRSPALRAHDRVDGPITVGRWRPLILLPASLFTQMPSELLEALLAHELAHIRRLDYLVNFLQCAVEALLFYHPVVWWLSHRMRIEREQIADDLAAEVLGSPRTLALALSELARMQSSRPPLALAATGGTLMARISRLLRPIRQPLGWKLLLPVAGLITLAIAARAAGLTAPPTPAVEPAPPTPAASPVPAARLAAATTITLGDGHQAFAFALVSASDGGTVMSGNDQDMREVKARRAAVHGDFLWVRQGRQRYVVTDPVALAEARALWEPVHAFDADMDALSRKIDEQSEAIERTAAEIEAAHDAPSAELEALEKRMAPLQKQRDKAQAQMDKLSRRMANTRDEKQLAQLEQQHERLEAALEPLDREIDALTEEMDRIGEAREQAMEQARQRHEPDADKAMEELSRQLEALGRQQEAAGQVAERRLRALIEDWVRRGLAKQA